MPGALAICMHLFWTSGISNFSKASIMRDIWHRSKARTRKRGSVYLASDLLFSNSWATKENYCITNFTMFKSGSKSNLEAEFQCKISLLDDTELSCDFKVRKVLLVNYNKCMSSGEMNDLARSLLFLSGHLGLVFLSVSSFSALSHVPFVVMILQSVLFLFCVWEIITLKTLPLSDLCVAEDRYIPEFRSKQNYDTFVQHICCID